MRKMKIPLDVTVCVPDNLNLMTPYVLLEQGDWFEEEMHFIRRLITPGNSAVDIGANYGVYTLTLAALTGRSGQVWAFEPASTTANFLEKSVHENGFQHVTVMRAALSNQPGQARLSTHDNAELNTLHGEQGSTGEVVPLTTLDLCLDRFAGSDISFLKLDAEGEEPNVIRGGAQFFAQQSPLVMFEIKHKSVVNLDLVDLFAAIGYESYRLIPGLGILVPFRRSDILDLAQLNLFACKHDRAQQLAERQLLVLEELSISVTAQNPNQWFDHLSKEAWAKDLQHGWRANYLASDESPEWLKHKLALNAYAVSQTIDHPPAVRLAALRHAYAGLRDLIARAPNAPRLCSFVRISSELGERVDSLNGLQQLQASLRQSGVVDLSEPFLPISARFDLLVPGEHLSDWLVGSLLEALERLSSFSSYFNPETSFRRLQGAVGLHFASDDIKRRLKLAQGRMSNFVDA